MFEQKRGRAPQLTPIVPMPIRPAPTETPDPVDPAAAVMLPPIPPFTWKLSNIVWTACAAVIVLLLLGSLLWKIAG